MSTPASGHAKCSKCEKPAYVRVPYAKLNLCREHFVEYFENRVLKSIEHYKMLKGVRRLLVAASGGKDSLSLAHLLAKHRERLGVELYVFHIDLGMGAYSEASRAAVGELCERHGLKCIVLGLRELLGYGLPELVKLSKRPACSLCGMLKRYFVNLVSVELGADAAALGHHMDDILVFALKNFLTQGGAGFLKLSPVARGVPGVMATRLKPLYEAYESDIYHYAVAEGVRFVEIECPFKYADPIKRAVREMLDKLEGEVPGFKVSLARRLARGAPAEEGEVRPCKYCGMASSSGVCAFCRLTSRVFGKPMGPEVRARVRSVVEALATASRQAS